MLEHIPSTAGAPQRISTSDGGRYLEMITPEGSELRLSAMQLRAACECAPCKRARFDGVIAERIEAISITEVTAVGGYAVNLAFSDGHARGIYPWIFLSRLAP